MTAVSESTGVEGLRGLVTLLTRQRDLYRQLQDQARRQNALIVGNDPEQLLALLGDRQQVLDQLAEVGDEIRPYQQAWPTMRGQLTPSLARQVDELLSEINTLLTEILAQDEKDAQVLSARRSAAAESLGMIRRDARVGVAYQASEQPAAAGREWNDE